MVRSIKEIFYSYGVVDRNGRHVNGSDKQTNHNYGDAYESLFPDRASIGLMLEVGVADGSSLLAWREVFPNATVVGMDIHPAAKFETGRFEFHLGDQTNLSDCRRVAKNRQFDFVCEDALHELGATLMTLLFLWPYVKPGGLYVIEEFYNIGELQFHIPALFPGAQVLPTVGPSGGIESLVILRKP